MTNSESLLPICQTCGDHVAQVDFYSHATQHIKDHARFMSEFNSSPISVPIVFQALGITPGSGVGE